MQNFSILSLFIFLVFCSASANAQSSKWITTDAGKQMKVFSTSPGANAKTSLKSASAATSGTNSLSTIFAANNSFAGNMFDVEVTGSSAIIVNGFDVNLQALDDPTCAIRVYYKEGTYIGHDHTASDWTLASEVPDVVPQGYDLPTHINIEGITLEPGITYGFYITVDDYLSAEILYTDGSDVYSNDDIEIRTGIGKGTPDFEGRTFNPRIWNGAIYYSFPTVVPFPMWAAVAVFLLILLTALFKFRKRILA